MKKLIIRADDFGYCEGVNYGIFKSITAGLVRSVGLMPNMPAAEHAFGLIKDSDVCLGQHSNVCVGMPCADPSKIPSLLNENGQFKSSRQYREAFKRGEETVELEEAVIELEAQYERFRQITGREPAYFEEHAVVSPNLNRALQIVAKNHGLRWQEIRFDEQPAIFDGKMFRLLLLNASVQPVYDPFESLKREIARHADEDLPMVAIFHPGYVDGYLLSHSSLTLNRAKEAEMLCDPMTARWLAEQELELVTYNDFD